MGPSFDYSDLEKDPQDILGVGLNSKGAIAAKASTATYGSGLSSSLSSSLTQLDSMNLSTDETYDSAYEKETDDDSESAYDDEMPFFDELPYIDLAPLGVKKTSFLDV